MIIRFSIINRLMRWITVCVQLTQHVSNENNFLQDIFYFFNFYLTARKCRRYWLCSEINLFDVSVSVCVWLVYMRRGAPPSQTPMPPLDMHLREILTTSHRRGPQGLWLASFTSTSFTVEGCPVTCPPKDCTRHLREQIIWFQIIFAD